MTGAPGSSVLHNGTIRPADGLRLAVSTQALHYGTGVFEGIRSYRNAAGDGANLFRVRDHYERLANGARTLRLDLAVGVDELCGLTAELEAAPTPAGAVAGADIICTTTSAREPLLSASDIAPGAHINAVGACQPGSRELASDLMAAARVVVDSRESALHESEELLKPMREGRFGRDHVVAELGEVLLGLRLGRREAHDVTVFDSLGLAVLDVLAGWYAVRAAHESGEAMELDFPRALSA